MQIAEVQFNPWDRIYYFDPAGIDIAPGDKVIVKTELGMELGEVVGLKEISRRDLKKENKREDVSAESTDNDPEIKPILRLATMHDTENLPSLADKRNALDYCVTKKEKYNLPMKFIDVHFSYDGSRLTFAFIADGRVDFRALVKDLTSHFGRTIRLQQIGIRDEAKIMGDIGGCGKNLCCRSHLKELKSITSDMAELQQCAHRGSDRISGICGRLLCCLTYEQEGYEEMLKKLPDVGRKVSVDGRRGVVVGQNILKQSVDVEFPGEKGAQPTIKEIDINRNKKK
jgi:cell fate regulator YaaT (PSP1 superfamily)